MLCYNDYSASVKTCKDAKLREPYLIFFPERKTTYTGIHEPSTLPVTCTMYIHELYSTTVCDPWKDQGMLGFLISGALLDNETRKDQTPPQCCEIVMNPDSQVHANTRQPYGSRPGSYRLNEISVV